MSTASKYTAMNGVIYLGPGALLIAWPGAVQTLFMDPPFAGHERALIRVIGLTVAVIGFLYLFGGRSGVRQIVAASVVPTKNSIRTGIRAFCENRHRIDALR